MTMKKELMLGLAALTLTFDSHADINLKFNVQQDLLRMYSMQTMIVDGIKVNYYPNLTYVSTSKQWCIESITFKEAQVKDYNCDNIPDDLYATMIDPKSKSQTFKLVHIDFKNQDDEGKQAYRSVMIEATRLMHSYSEYLENEISVH